MSNRIPLIVSLISLLLLSVIFLVPLNSDGDLYQAMAVDLVRYGKLPYTGSWDQNFPGIVYIHAASIILFGNSDAGFRVLDLICNLFICYALYRFSLRITNTGIALLAPVLYAVYYVSGGWWSIGQRDVFACAFLLGAGLVSIARTRSTLRRELLQGVLIGCATMIRPTYGLFLPLTFLLDRDWRSFLQRCIGFAIPVILVFLPYVVNGRLNEVYLALIAYNSSSYATISEPWWMLWERTPLQWIVLGFALTGIYLSLRTHESAKIGILLIGCLTGLVSLVVMRKFFVYHVHVFFSFLIPLALVPVHALLARSRNAMTIWIVTGGLAIVSIVSFYPRHLIRMFLYGEGDMGSRVGAVYAQHSIDSSFGRSIDDKLSAYLERTHNVELVSVTPAVHWMNELDRPSRFTMIHPLAITGNDGSFTDFQQQWRTEYLDSLRRRTPERIVLADGPQMLMRYIRRSPKDLALEIPGFAELLKEHYVFDTLIGGYNIYTRTIP